MGGPGRGIMTSCLCIYPKFNTHRPWWRCASPRENHACVDITKLKLVFYNSPCQALGRNNRSFKNIVKLYIRRLN